MTPHNARQWLAHTLNFPAGSSHVLSEFWNLESPRDWEDNRLLHSKRIPASIRTFALQGRALARSYILFGEFPLITIPPVDAREPGCVASSVIIK